MKKKRPIADRKYKEVRKFITAVFDRKYSTEIFEKNIVLDDGTTIVFVKNFKEHDQGYRSFDNVLIINDGIYICNRGNLSDVPTKHLHAIYQTIHNSLDSIIFQIHL